MNKERHCKISIVISKIPGAKYLKKHKVPRGI
jgi:hypothetical protein